MIDIDSICDQLEEISEWAEENDLPEFLAARAEILAIAERISSLHLRVVP